MSRLSIGNRSGTCCRKAQVLVTRLRAKEAEADVGNVREKLLAVYGERRGMGIQSGAKWPHSSLQLELSFGAARRNLVSPPDGTSQGPSRESSVALTVLKFEVCSIRK